MTEITTRDIISVDGGLYGVVSLSFFGLKLRIAPVKPEGSGEWYSNTGQPFWVRKSTLAGAEVVDSFARILLSPC